MCDRLRKGSGGSYPLQRYTPEWFLRVRRRAKLASKRSTARDKKPYAVEGVHQTRLPTLLTWLIATPTDTHRYCIDCDRMLPHNAYYGLGKNTRGMKKFPCCKKCRNQQVAKRRRDSPEKERALREKAKLERWKRTYGIDQTTYNQMITSQQGRCAICEDSLCMGKHTHIDHCHKTGRVRGVLCTRCNNGIGLFKDSVQNLTKAINYLSTVQK
jgi:hypothetical protein